MAGKQRPNPYLASASYSLTAFDPEPSDSFPYPVRRGEFRFDLWSLAHLAAGPVNIMNLASPVPDRMWAMSTDRVAYVDTSNGQWSGLAEIDLPGVTRIPRSALDELAGTVSGPAGMNPGADARKEQRHREQHDGKHVVIRALDVMSDGLR